MVDVNGPSEACEVDEVCGCGEAAGGGGEEDLAPRYEATCLKLAQVVEVVGRRDAEAAGEVGLESASLPGMRKVTIIDMPPSENLSTITDRLCLLS